MNIISDIITPIAVVLMLGYIVYELYKLYKLPKQKEKTKEIEKIKELVTKPLPPKEKIVIPKVTISFDQPEPKKDEENAKG